jgi:hypothetical protein
MAPRCLQPILSVVLLVLGLNVGRLLLQRMGPTPGAGNTCPSRIIRFHQLPCHPCATSSYPTAPPCVASVAERAAPSPLKQEAAPDGIAKNYFGDEPAAPPAVASGKWGASFCPFVVDLSPAPQPPCHHTSQQHPNSHSCQPIAKHAHVRICLLPPFLPLAHDHHFCSCHISS